MYKCLLMCHSRQLLKMVRRDTVVGGVSIAPMQECFATPTFTITYYTMCTLINGIKNNHIFMPSNRGSLLTQLISTTCMACILLTYMTKLAYCPKK